MTTGRKIPGDRLRIAAEDYNAFIDAARASKDAKFSGSPLARQLRKSQTLVLVKNSTGGLRGQFQVLGLNGVLNYDGLDPTDVKSRPVFDGVALSDTYHQKNFCVLQETLLPGSVGIACVGGITYVDILPSATVTDLYAKIVSGDYYLQQDPTSGGADILWRYNGVGSPTLPAIVRIPSTRIVSGNTGARVYHSSNQTVTPSGLVLDFNTEDYDGENYHSGGSPKKLTIPENGRYLFGAQCELNLPSANTNAYMSVRSGGSAELAKVSGHQGDNGGLLNLNCSMVGELLSGSYLEVLVSHDDPMGNATVNSTSGVSPYFWIQRL